ncbi:MAG TPA: S41 family peptidase [Pirellulales bacterium]|nr:S41 family peptidase [Pirellulales bacterium]
MAHRVSFGLRTSSLVRAFSLVWASGLGLLLLSPVGVRAQTASPSRQTAVSTPATPDASARSGAAPAEDETEIAELLDRGRRLEGERRWGEALTLYEDALRLHPTAPHFEQRLYLSRIHYDLGRRYSDRSFRETVRTMDARQAIDLYSEVLQQVQRHYVDNPNWRRLADSGITELEVALADPLFLEANLPQAPKARVERFRHDLRSRVGAQKIDNRHAAVEVAGRAARLCRAELGLAESATIHEFICGAANALDPYSAFLTASQLNEVYSQIEGNFVGLGVELKSDNGALLIVKVIPGSPAQRAGIAASDRIVAVDGRSTSELSTDQAANLLQGQEGSYVTVTAVTAGQAPRQVRVRREHVEVPSIEDAAIVDSAFGVAYLKLTCFQKTTSRDLDTALWKLHRQGMRALIIDLRKNPGGLLTTAVEVVDKFVDRGTIVSTHGRNRAEDYVYSAREAGTWRVPLVVLIDGDSASASEIFAGAIRDFGRGVIVGSRSYGKGSVQGIFPLNLANSGLRLTTAKFYSPKGKPFSGIGVTPEVMVRHRVARPVLDQADEAAAPADEALEEAIRQARHKIAPAKVR